MQDRAIHDRRPVVLRLEHVAAWLDTKTNAQRVKRILADCHGDFECSKRAAMSARYTLLVAAGIYTGQRHYLVSPEKF